MTKAPRAGQVKTRLTPPLTPEEAAVLNTCFLRDTAAAISASITTGGARGIAVYTPAGAEEEFAEILPSHFELVLQRGDALSERLINATEDLFKIGFQSLCLIDSDSPTVPQNAYAQAVAWLSTGEERIVLGPSHDGGYYLIGLNRMHRRIFEDITWSTPHVFEQTMQRAKKIGVAVELLPTWYDVDDRATLCRLCDELLGDKANDVGGYPAPETRAFLENLVAREKRGRFWPAE